MDLGGIVWTLFSTEYFTLGDLVLFYILWTEVVPWISKKWKEYRGFSWKCQYCPKKHGFRISTNNKGTTARVVEDHLMKFHQQDMLDSLKKERP